MTAQANALQALGSQSAVLLLLLLFVAVTACPSVLFSRSANQQVAGSAGRSAGSRSDCGSPSRVCDGVADCVDGSDEAGCDFVTSGQEISLRPAAFKEYALSCYCTSRCQYGYIEDFSCTATYCPIINDLGGCVYYYARFYIQVLGAKNGTVIRSGDPVGLLYDSELEMWLSCSAEKEKCISHKCPGLFSAVQNNQDCVAERFVIMLADDSEAARRCFSDPGCVRQPIKRGSRVVLKHAGGLLWAPTEKGKVRVGNCSLLDSEILARVVMDCPNNVWKILDVVF